MAIQPDQIVAFEMTAREWDVVFQALGDVPYRVSNPVIQKLGQQLQKYNDAPPAPGAHINGSGEVEGVQQ